MACRFTNEDLRPLYEAAVARQQADQIYNLSLTRTATKALLAPGTRGVIGIGRVKTPTLAIICLRELEIRNFKPEDYFEIVAMAHVTGGEFPMRHAPPVKQRIKDRARADAIAHAAAGHRGPLGVSAECLVGRSVHRLCQAHPTPRVQGPDHLRSIPG